MRLAVTDATIQTTTGAAFAHSVDETLAAQAVNPTTGLSAAEVQRRRERYGPNALRQVEQRSALQILLTQFKSIIVYLLLFAAGLAFVFGDVIEGVAVLIVILINAGIGFFIELQAVRSMESLRQLGQTTSKVRRDGRVQEIPAEDLVPGDIVLLEGGDIISADMRLIEESRLQIDESPLTGESVPVNKQIAPLPLDTELAERTNMAYKGTAVTRGSGVGVVIGTGMNTELGRISALVAEAEDETTPLEERLDQLGQRLVWVTVVIAIIVIIGGVLTGKDLILMIETAIALAVASIPEGLPIVATIALARGMYRMAQHRALVNRLSAVETLGATTIIATDKTGTLTENRMTVDQIVTLHRQVDFSADGRAAADDPILRDALKIGVLCNNASLPASDDAPPVGDPLEVALLLAGAKVGLRQEELLRELPEVRESAFDPQHNMMATVHRQPDGRYYVAVKGAPESVIHASSFFKSETGIVPLTEDQHHQWVTRNDELAATGLRMLGVAEKIVDSPDVDPYTDLVLVGLVALLDPPRADVRDAILAARRAGIRLVMVTGDQPATALTIAREIGLVEDERAEVIRGRDLKPVEQLNDAECDRIANTSVFARVSPEQKLDLIGIHQSRGERVAMTGDGVNDAPALKKADIGIAMGQRGTQVAREAADMVLQDDALSTIVYAIEQGRVIFDNIRRFVIFLLSCNMSEIFVVGLASLVSETLPILPLQILFLNLVTDVFPALALGVGEGDKAVMTRPPRDPAEPIVTRQRWLEVIGYSALISAGTLGAFALATVGLHASTEQAVTIAFLTLAFAQLWHVFNMRDNRASIINNDVTRNPYIWAALAFCTLLLLAAVYVPVLNRVLETTNPGSVGWALVLLMSLLPMFITQIAKQLLSRS
ncbi:MAG: HAD-IC family P-type ATPase [Chloroflexi bacterium]|nr:HAD-IC family P-type ATPase [Chloroflexota bacterium]